MGSVAALLVILILGATLRINLASVLGIVSALLVYRRI